MVSPAEYANILAVPYTRPLHPGPLVLPPNLTEHNEIRRRADHKKRMTFFHDMVNIENALRKQISEAVDELSLKELRDTITNTI